jgi:hypothetical protein
MSLLAVSGRTVVVDAYDVGASSRFLTRSRLRARDSLVTPVKVIQRGGFVA